MKTDKINIKPGIRRQRQPKKVRGREKGSEDRKKESQENDYVKARKLLSALNIYSSIMRSLQVYPFLLQHQEINMYWIHIDTPFISAPDEWQAFLHLTKAV